MSDENKSIAKLGSEATILIDRLTVFIDDVEDYQEKGKEKNFNKMNTAIALSNVNKLSDLVLKMIGKSFKKKEEGS